jgi:hypothetical protein
MRQKGSGLLSNSAKISVPVVRRPVFQREELGRRAALSLDEIGSLERGESDPRSDVIVELASALSVSAEELRKGSAWNCSGPQIEPEAPLQELVLQETIQLLPVHPTLHEMFVWLFDKHGRRDEAAIRDAVRGLERSGLIRSRGDILEPTLAGYQATNLLAELLDE